MLSRPALLKVRVSRTPPPLTVAVEVAVLVMVPLPERVPLFQLNAELTEIDCVPLICPPLRVRVATVTGMSRVTTWPPLTVAVSPEPGTPAPPQVEALLQLPLVVLLNDAAKPGAAAQSTTINTPKRTMALVMEPLSMTRNASRTPSRRFRTLPQTGTRGL